ncbi:MAG: transcriptional regulator, MerR family [Acidimicrobiaceae bacterium]|nr:transcriptional regulator, MerR family [Acidimicrobiaceae bacterium]
MTEPAAMLRIGEAAQRAGVSERTLRYYEEIGLLVPAGHSTGGCREYGAEELARVQQIRELQELIGLNLEEIRNVVTREDRIGALRDAYRRTESPSERHELLLEALEVTEALHSRVAAKVARIEEFRDDLAERIERYRSLLAEEAAAPAPSPA